MYTTLATRSVSYPSLEHLLDRFNPIYLAELNGDAALLNRIDTKYLFPLSALHTVLEQIQDHYQILDINDVRLNQYHTVYYDEPGFTFYNQHHNEHSHRYKVRERQYVDSNIAFFEVKTKTNQKRTIKTRLPLDTDPTPQPDDIADFIENYVPTQSDWLEAKLWNDYLRLTLVDQQMPERVTIDIALSFGHEHNRVELPGFVIAEVKQAHFTQHSYFIQQMRRLGIRSSSFSKYCAGVYLLYDNVKTNNFKPVMREVQKLVETENFHARVS
ncbi:MAG: polyphosphate polymerase domain-containing protein [Anaerolineae bacterium]|nr:polyphosphate polymerase domain-containing protein [Anaerolineae bacterium]